MKKTITLLSSVVLLSSCASAYNYKVDYGNNTKVLDSYHVSARIEKHYTPGIFSTEVKNDVTLYINDEIVLKGPLHKDESGQLQGIYQDQLVTLECAKPGMFLETRCTIHMGKKRLGIMTMTPEL
ncbi:hypothetical protein NFHSH190041_11960 [Shewanella sp. NFH-SH190041]|uniref:hypothetical protein n=1 Tax=Shewanella sp. NFH-SH190041 TaxID=2950245 RepID=UPI0021C3F79E|nr:hypothetical protein [Shewanella sp. NFH-SH190041]BDM63744.1 hypothetical protein NFHSH190041_11960 [Shewanella sp. NFH-SH190041]